MGLPINDAAGDGYAVRADRRTLWIAAALIALSLVTQSLTKVMEAARTGLALDAGHIWLLESTSHAAILALTPLFIPLLNHAQLRRQAWPWVVPVHVVAGMAFSALHVGAMGAARRALFPPLMGYSYEFNLWSPSNLAFEFAKDVFTYALLIFGFTANRMLEKRMAAARATRAADIAAGRIALPSGGSTIFFNPREIVYAKAAENYVEIYAGSKPQLVRITLARLEKLLRDHGRRHVRVHRSYLVNLDFVRAVTPTGEGDVVIRLGENLTVPGSRRFRENLKTVDSA